MNLKLDGAKVRAARERVGLKQVELSRRLKVSQAFVSRMEKGERGGRLRTVVKLARVLGVRPEELLDGPLTPGVKLSLAAKGGRGRPVSQDAMRREEATGHRAMGLRLRRLRQKKGPTTTQLAEMVGVTEAQISRLENGRRGFRSATLIRIAKALGVAPSYFYLEDTSEAEGRKPAGTGGLSIESQLSMARRDAAFRQFMDRMASVYKTDPKTCNDFTQALDRMIRASGRG